MVVKLIVFESRGEYRCVIVFDEIPEAVVNKRIVYQDEAEGENLAETRGATEEMRKKAKEWAREQGIDFVYNLDFGRFN